MTLTPYADLYISMNGTNPLQTNSSSPGSVDTYTIDVTNNGPSDVTGATLSDVFPSSLTGLSVVSTNPLFTAFGQRQCLGQQRRVQRQHAH